MEGTSSLEQRRQRPLQHPLVESISEVQEVARRLAHFGATQVFCAADDAMYRLKLNKPAAMFVSRWPPEHSEKEAEHVEPHQVPPDVIAGWHHMLDQASAKSS